MTTAVANDADIAPIEAALDALLVAIFDHEERTRAAVSVGESLVPIRLTAFTWQDIHNLPTRDHTAASEIIRDPIGGAFRAAITQLGKRLFRTVGLSGMSEVLERVAEQDSSHYARRASIMDHAWEGIGEGEDRWHA